MCALRSDGCQFFGQLCVFRSMQEIGDCDDVGMRDSGLDPAFQVLMTDDDLRVFRDPLELDVLDLSNICL